MYLTRYAYKIIVQFLLQGQQHILQSTVHTYRYGGITVQLNYHFFGGAHIISMVYDKYYDMIFDNLNEIIAFSATQV